MKVYVITEAKLFREERYVTVKATMKEAEKTVRKIAPHAKPTDSNASNQKAYFSDGSKQMLLFIREEEI